MILKKNVNRTNSTCFVDCRYLFLNYQYYKDGSEKKNNLCSASQFSLSVSAATYFIEPPTLVLKFDLTHVVSGYGSLLCTCMTLKLGPTVVPTFPIPSKFELYCIVRFQKFVAFSFSLFSERLQKCIIVR